MSPAELGATIRRRRLAMGLSQAQLGRLVGRSSSAVAGWESGKASPRDDATMGALTDALGLETARAESDPWGPTVVDREPNEAAAASNGGMLTSDTRPDEPPTDSRAVVVSTPEPGAETVPEPAPRMSTVVVAPNRRMANRVVRSTGGTATIGVVTSVRTDVDPVYRSRAVATAAVLVACGVVFVWAAALALSEVGSIIETLLEPFR